MRKAILSVSAILFTVGPAAQTPPRSAVDITAADIKAVRKARPQAVDQQIRVVDIGKYNVAVAVLHREERPGAQGGPISHDQVTEIYYITEGSGTLVTGGILVGGKPSAAESEVVKVLVGPTVTGVSLQNAQSRKVGTGDVIIIPLSVGHYFTSIEGHIDYLVFRVDGDHVLPAGYVNDAVKK
jgi:mannose-6-phosphate isomerase-like protein (cupin superfamily)